MEERAPWVSSNPRVAAAAADGTVPVGAEPLAGEAGHESPVSPLGKQDWPLLPGDAGALCRPGPPPPHEPMSSRCSAVPGCGGGGGLSWHRPRDFCLPPGMPFNQLGTLAGGKYYNVEAMYCYLRW